MNQASREADVYYQTKAENHLKLLKLTPCKNCPNAYTWIHRGELVGFCLEKEEPINHEWLNESIYKVCGEIDW